MHTYSNLLSPWYTLDMLMLHLWVHWTLDLWITFFTSLQSNCTIALGTGLRTTFFWHSYLFSESYAHFTWGIIYCFGDATCSRQCCEVCGLHFSYAHYFHCCVHSLVSILSFTCGPFALWKELRVARSCVNTAVYFWIVLLSRLSFTCECWWSSTCEQLNCQDCHLLVNRCFRKIVIYLWTPQTPRLPLTCEQFLSRWPFTCEQFLSRWPFTFIIFLSQDSNLDNPARPLSSKKSCTWSSVKLLQRFSNNLVKVHH